MRFATISFLAIFLILFQIGELFPAQKDIYYKEATIDKWGDYKYKGKITKKASAGIPYYLVSYNRWLVISERHFSSKRSLLYIAKYQYLRKGGYSKVEIHLKEKLIKVKLKKPLSRGVRSKNPGARYAEIKYLTFLGKTKKISKVEEYYSNGQVMTISFYNIKEQLDKQESFSRNGKRTSTKYYGHIHDKNILLKEEVYDKKGIYTGHWVHEYNEKGQPIKKNFTKSANQNPKK